MKRPLLALLFGAAISSSASATTFQFGCIAGQATACSVGEAALSADVTDAGPGRVSVVISSSASGAAAVMGLYIDDAGLISSISNQGGAGVAFKKNGSPSDLVGGSAVSFVDDFRLLAKKPRATNGINGGESLTVVLRLKKGVTFSDVLAALGDGSLRLGLTLIEADPNCVGQNTGPNCMGDPGTASFVNRPGAVPEPALAALAALGALGAALRSRKH
jgi:hypothetical protein